MTELISLGWDGSSGGTYLWHMIQQDVLGRYRPAGGKLRLIVITDGHDTLSPAQYAGLRGMGTLVQQWEKSKPGPRRSSMLRCISCC